MLNQRHIGGGRIRKMGGGGGGQSFRILGEQIPSMENDGVTTSIRRYDVDSTLRRRFDVISTSCAH